MAMAIVSFYLVVAVVLLLVRDRTLGLKKDQDRDRDCLWSLDSAMNRL